METLHAKVAADSLLKSASTEDEFYNQNSCEWLQFIRTLAKRGRSPEAQCNGVRPLSYEKNES